MTYRRGRWCYNSNSWMTVNVNGLKGIGSSCKVLRAATVSPDSYQVQFSCSGEGETWTENNRMSLDNQGRLIMHREQSEAHVPVIIGGDASL